jgi:hypothetical protein
MFSTAPLHKAGQKRLAPPPRNKKSPGAAIETYGRDALEARTISFIIKGKTKTPKEKPANFA